MRRIAIPLALLGVLTLGGCGGEASPAPAPLTKTPSPSTAAPSRPAAASGLGEDAARETIRFYLDALTYASNTGDTSALAPLSAPGCDSCEGVIEATKTIYAAGGMISGSKYTVAGFTRTARTSDGFQIGLRVRSAAERVRRSESASPTQNPSSVVAATFEVAARTDRYVIVKWGQT